ncbi:TPA: relaxase/mobilization nuclease domain-containing protein [Klebsiella pneumoniae]|nr:relaxase/mobilization nuclease domain-containing protein [Salmonella enterica subsp. enterica serovar Newport]HDZ1577652.1 relaxase/mobilization nuclease domain-containing protein [Klebsiella pneumoniae]
MVIPKIIEGRRDKKSSFGQLIKYMADKPSQELTDTVQPTPETALAVKSDMFEGLNNYLTRKQKVISTPVDVEPGVQRVVVGDVTCQYNTFSLDGAAQEMNSVSQQNTRCKDPVMHYVLSWPDYEKPNDDQVFDSVKFTLASMGMSDHQYVAAIHRDTDNLHVHVAVNRINPQTYKAASSSFTKDTLHQACRLLELKNGWSHSNGAYVVNDRQQIVRNPHSKKERGNWRSLDRINKMEHKEGVETLYRYIVGDEQVGGSRQNLIHVSAGLREAKSWDDVHKTFADIGLRVEKAQGKKGYVITHEHQNQKTAVKASLVFNKAQYTLKSMEERFGEYQPSHIEPAKVSVFKTAYAPGAYRRDANKRLQRKIERAEERMLLKGRYRAYRNNLPIYSPDKDRIADEYRKIAQHTRLVKNNVRHSVSDPHTRKLMYNLAEFKRLQAVANLRLSLREDRNGFRAANPRLSYREWVEQEALKGDKAALSQMRGFAYSSRKKEKYKQQLVEQIGFNRTFNAITSHDRDDVAVMASARHGVKPRLLKDGTVIFERDGKPVAADRGHIVLTESNGIDKEKTADLAIALTIAGKAKSVRVDGDGEFKELCCNRIVDAAVNHNHPVAQGITFTDAAQQAYAQNEKHRLIREQNNSKNEMQFRSEIDDKFNPK